MRVLVMMGMARREFPTPQELFVVRAAIGVLIVVVGHMKEMCPHGLKLFDLGIKG